MLREQTKNNVDVEKRKLRKKGSNSDDGLGYNFVARSPTPAL